MSENVYKHAGTISMTADIWANFITFAFGERREQMIEQAKRTWPDRDWDDL